MMPGQHGFPRLGCGLSSPPLWAWRCRQGNPDASLFVFGAGAGARARRAAGRHDDVLRGGSTGSVHRRGALTHAGRSGHTHPHNTDCRGHNRGRCAPALRSACSCTIETSARCPPCSRVALDKAAQHWHKGEANAPSNARAQVEGPGFCQELLPGLRLSSVREQDTAIAPWCGHGICIRHFVTAASATTFDSTRQNRQTRPVQIQNQAMASEKHGEQF